MVRLILLIRRKAGTSREEFIRHYEEVHAPLVRATFPEIDGYVRNYRPVAVGFTDISTIDWDCMTESSFATEERYASFLAKLADPAIASVIYEDGENFMDNGATQMLVTTSEPSASSDAAHSSDIDQIQNLKSRYLELVDLLCDSRNPGSPEPIYDLFTEDAVLDFGGIMGSYVGREGHATIFGNLLPAQHNWTWHSSGSPQIVIEGDKARASWTLYALSNPVGSGNDVTLATFGQYSDEFVRTPSGWKQSRLGFKMRGQTGGSWKMP